MMKKRGLIIGCVALALLIVVAAGVFFVYRNLGDILVAAIEEYGPPITQTTVSVDGIDLDPVDGKGVMTGLVIGNPQGYKTKSAFELGSVKLKVDITTVTGSPVVINYIEVDKPVVTYELGAKMSNLEALQGNIDRSVKRLAGKSGGRNSGGDADGGSSTKIIIDRLVIRNGVVNVSAPFLQGKTLTTKLPLITLRDIGRKTNGVLAQDAAKQIIGAITKAAGGAVGKLNLGAMQKRLESAAKGASEALKKATGGSGDAKKAVEDAGKSLKKLFGN